MTTPELIDWLQTNDALVELLEAWNLKLNFDVQNNRPWRDQVRVLLLRICEDVRALEDAVLAERMLDILLDERLLDLLVDHLEQASRKFTNGGPIGWFLMLTRMFRAEVLLRLQIINEFAIRQKHGFD